jgi:ABC-type dipeptide/oligopeptide/nickel transport system permease subunit
MSVNTPELAVLDERPERGHALRIATRQFVRNRAAVAGLAFLVLICAVTVLAPVLAPCDPVKIQLANKLQPPSLLHWFGTTSAAMSCLASFTADASRCWLVSW